MQIQKNNIIKTKAAKMATGRELKEVQVSDTDNLDSVEVAERVHDVVVPGVHEERAAALELVRLMRIQVYMSTYTAPACGGSSRTG